MQNNIIKAIIGLGNPGKEYYYQRHSIGFRILDHLASLYGEQWKKEPKQEVTTIHYDNHAVLLIKPQTFMNSSGLVIPNLLKKGIKPENILVVHDELELPYGEVKVKQGGSHKGHNGLKSIIAACGPDFFKLRFGIGRPANKNDVPQYVLHNFNKEEQLSLENYIDSAVLLIQESYLK